MRGRSLVRSSGSKSKGRTSYSLKPLREGVLGVPSKKIMKELCVHWSTATDSGKKNV